MKYEVQYRSTVSDQWSFSADHECLIQAIKQAQHSQERNGLLYRVILEETRYSSYPTVLASIP